MPIAKGKAKAKAKAKKHQCLQIAKSTHLRCKQCVSTQDVKQGIKYCFQHRTSHGEEEEQEIDMKEIQETAKARREELKQMKEIQDTAKARKEELKQKKSKTKVGFQLKPKKTEELKHLSFARQISPLAKYYPPACNLRVKLHDLMNSHSYRTYQFVVHWNQFNRDLNNSNVKASLAYLLMNQRNIGEAFNQVYNDETLGRNVEKLFITHILLAAPVLKAAAALNGVKSPTGGKKEKETLDKAMEKWRANGKEIADTIFALPLPPSATEALKVKEARMQDSSETWTKEHLEQIFDTHLNQVATYATLVIKNRIDASLLEFENSRKHLLNFADLLNSRFR